MEEDVQHFQHIMLYWTGKKKKGKKATEMHFKKFVQCMEKVLWLIKCVKKWFVKFLGTINILAK